MKVGFLDTLAMVALGVGQTEEALLQKRAISHVSNTSRARGAGRTHSSSFQNEKAIF